MRTMNLDLIMQKGSRVVHMIIAQKLFRLFTDLKVESQNKVALAEELSISAYFIYTMF